jgi:hypothetical protein
MDEAFPLFFVMQRCYGSNYRRSGAHGVQASTAVIRPKRKRRRER